MVLYDIAKLAGVSQATVSRVFSHHPNVKKEVRERVLSIAKQHNYHPRLPSKQRNVVILLPEEEIYPIRNCLEMVMMALTAVLPKRGFRIEILPVNNMDRLESIQFCGAVAIGTDPEVFRNWDSRFTSPLVLIDREAPAGAPNIYSVRSDEVQGMDLAIGHLYERGCRRIGCVIHGKAGTGNADIRRTSVITALNSRNLPSHDALVKLADTDNHYIEIIGKLLKQKIDALFCPGGNAGIIAAYALSLFNKRVPDDISLIASEHKLFSCHATPPQTTITQNHEELARLTAEIIETSLDGRGLPRRRLLPYSIIIRDSVVVAG